MVGYLPPLVPSVMQMAVGSPFLPVAPIQELLPLAHFSSERGFYGWMHPQRPGQIIPLYLFLTWVYSQAGRYMYVSLCLLSLKNAFVKISRVKKQSLHNYIKQLPN